MNEQELTTARRRLPRKFKSLSSVCTELSKVYWEGRRGLLDKQEMKTLAQVLNTVTHVITRQKELDLDKRLVELEELIRAKS